jgi:predicted RNase H-like nuclease (RuvC/YqgF family)
MDGPVAESIYSIALSSVAQATRQAYEEVFKKQEANMATLFEEMKSMRSEISVLASELRSLKRKLDALEGFQVESDNVRKTICPNGFEADTKKQESCIASYLESQKMLNREISSHIRSLMLNNPRYERHWVSQQLSRKAKSKYFDIVYVRRKKNEDWWPAVVVDRNVGKFLANEVLLAHPLKSLIKKDITSNHRENTIDTCLVKRFCEFVLVKYDFDSGAQYAWCRFENVIPFNHSLYSHRAKLSAKLKSAVDLAKARTVELAEHDFRFKRQTRIVDCDVDSCAE